MTKIDARKVLGISRSAGLKAAERAYRQKCKELQVRMVPGNPISVRQQVQTELVEITSAWKTLQRAKPTRKKTAKKAKSTRSRKPAPRQRPHRLADSWEYFFSLLPFSKPVIVTVVIFLLVTTIIFIKQLAKGV